METTTRKFATIGDAYALTNDPYVNLRRYATAEDYHAAMTNPSVKNDASKHIDADGEAYLIDLEAVEMGVHPFTAVHDVMIKKSDDGKIGLDTLHTTHYVGRNTLLAFK